MSPGEIRDFFLCLSPVGEGGWAKRNPAFWFSKSGIVADFNQEALQETGGLLLYHKVVINEDCFVALLALGSSQWLYSLPDSHTIHKQIKLNALSLRGALRRSNLYLIVSNIISNFPDKYRGATKWVPSKKRPSHNIIETAFLFEFFWWFIKTSGFEEISIGFPTKTRIFF